MSKTYRMIVKVKDFKTIISVQRKTWIGWIEREGIVIMSNDFVSHKTAAIKDASRLAKKYNIPHYRNKIIGELFF